MWKIIVSITLVMQSPILSPPEIGPKHVSCIDGHIVETYDQCPPSAPHIPASQVPYGGGHGRGGLLGLGIGGIL